MEKRRLAFLLSTTAILFISTNLCSQLNWSQPVTSPCYKGFEARAAFIKYSTAVNQYEWICEVKNNYNRLVHFNMSWVIGNEKKSIGRFSLQPGRSTNAVSHYFNSSATNWLVGIESVCFGDNWMSCAGNCYADCDIRPGVPNQLSEQDCKGLQNTNTSPAYPDASKSNTSVPGTTGNQGSYTPPAQAGQSQVMNLLQNQEFVNGVGNALDDLFEAIRQRKEEKKKLKEAKKAEKIKNEAIEAMFNSNETATYLQFITSQLEENNKYAFRKLSHYSMNDTYKFVRLLFDQAEIDISYFYFAPLYDGDGSLTRRLALKFKTQALLDVFLQSATFKLLSRHSKPNNTLMNSDFTYIFDEIDFSNSKEYREFGKQLSNNSVSFTIFHLMDSVTQRTEGPIDTSRNLGQVLVERGDAYSQGIGVRIDSKIAIYYYEKAAQLGYPDAMYRLHNTYKYVEALKDAGKSLYWLEQACLQTYGSSFYCAEYEKYAGRPVNHPQPQKILVPENYSEWKQNDSNNTRITIYNTGDSLFMSRSGIPGYSAYVKSSPGVYKWLKNNPGETSYMIRVMNDSVMMKLVYGKDTSFPIRIDNLTLQSIIPDYAEVTAAAEDIPVSELTGDWYSDNHKSVKFTISPGNGSMFQGKFAGMNTESYKKVVINTYQFENPSMSVTLTVLNKSKLAVTIYYKASGMYSTGSYSR
jgi:hypothetical protein